VKKTISGLAALAIILGSLAGCSGSSGSSGSTGSSAASGSSGAGSSSAATEPSSNFNKEGMPIVNEKVELSVFQYCRDADEIPWDNLWYYQNLEEQTNVHVNLDVVIDSDWDTKLNLMLASGEYNDIVMSHKTVNYEEHGVNQGIYIPLDDLIDQYMPTYKERVAQDPSLVRGLVASDGKTYTLGGITAQDIHCGNMLFINKTWLKNLNLEKPKTLDELTEVLRAFKAQDANGNGDPNDEIPYETTFDDFYKMSLSFFGVPENAELWVSIDDDAKVRLNASMDAYREAMEWMHMIYSEGLVEQEVLTIEGNASSDKIKSGLAGFIPRWRLLNHSIDEVKDDFELIIPVNAEGHQAKMPTTMEVAAPIVTITNQCKNPEIAARWLDKQLETQTAFEMYYGPEGTTWFYNDNGKVELKDGGDRESIKYCPGVNCQFYANAEWYFNVFEIPDFRLEKAAYDDEYEAAGVYEKYPYQYFTKLVTVTTDENSQLTLIKTDLTSLIKENISNAILNGVTDSSWETFQNNLKNAQSEKYVELYQNILDRYLANS